MVGDSSCVALASVDIASPPLTTSRVCDSRSIASPLELDVVPNPEAAAAKAAEELERLATRGGSVALAGGSTPQRAYELAALRSPDWSAVDVWLGDERCVPQDDPRSNALLARTSLLDRLTVPPRSFHPVDTTLSPEDAAAAYARALEGTTFDLVLLGLGEDGHTASLFPRSPALREQRTLAVAAEPALEPRVARVTLTLPALTAARRIVFLAVGSGKAEAVRRAFAEAPSPDVPASLVRSAAGATVAILDDEAAAHLHLETRD